MPFDRRRFLGLGAAAAVTSVAGRALAATAPISALGLDAAQFGVRPGAADDQSRALQHAIDEAARAHAPLALAPGVYRAGGLNLPSGAQLIGVRGATKLIFTDGPSLLAAERADRITLSGLSFDGANRKLGNGHGLVHLENARALRISDCELTDAGGTALQCFAVEGQIAGNTITGAAEAAIHSNDALGLLIANNTIRDAGDNGILIWRSDSGDDGSIVVDNRIEAIANRSGGSGQYGNAVNVFRASNVIVRGNRINNCAFSAVRGNAASNIHIEGNAITDTREVALYSEFEFEGCVISGNTVDSAAIGISVTNFNRGGRLGVIQGNLIRNLLTKRPAGTDPSDGAGIGISAEADCAITGNTIENAPTAGLELGFGQYLRDIAATGNVIRRTGIGVAVSVAPGAGTALIANNVISAAARGAIIGMNRGLSVTGDLLKSGGQSYANLTISGNRVS